MRISLDSTKLRWYCSDYVLGARSFGDSSAAAMRSVSAALKGWLASEIDYCPERCRGSVPTRLSELSVRGLSSAFGRRRSQSQSEGRKALACGPAHTQRAGKMVALVKDGSGPKRAPRCSYTVRTHARTPSRGWRPVISSTAYSPLRDADGSCRCGPLPGRRTTAGQDRAMERATTRRCRAAWRCKMAMPRPPTCQPRR